MKNNNIRLLGAQTSSPKLSFISSVIVLAVILGIFFRCFRIEHQVYWNDEVFSSLRTSGTPLSEVRHKLAQREISKDELMKYQKFNPANGFQGVVRSAKEEPQHPPLYFMLQAAVTQTVGYSVGAMRGVSVFFGLLSLAGVYWLGRELFADRLAAQIAVALVAVSPFHVLYSQTARSYTLWITLICFSYIALLRALRTKKIQSWVLYSLTVICGLYSFLLFALVTLGQGAYVAIQQRFRLNRSVALYLLALLASLAAFTPWIAVVAENSASLSSSSGWVTADITFLTRIKDWAFDTLRIFCDLNVPWDFAFKGRADTRQTLPSVILLLLCGWSVCYFFSQSSWQSRVLMASLIGGTFLPLWLADFFLGGQRTAIMRYLAPCYLGIQFCLAYFIANKITGQKSSADKIRHFDNAAHTNGTDSISNISSTSNDGEINPLYDQLPKQLAAGRLWTSILATILTLGVISCVALKSSRAWWSSYLAETHLQTAEVINSSRHPLIVASLHDVIPLMAVNYLLAEDVKFLLVERPQALHDTLASKIVQHDGDVFFFRFSSKDAGKTAIRLRHQLRAVISKPEAILWRMAP
jgi:uncharacterized membrane protein